MNEELKSIRYYIMSSIEKCICTGVGNACYNKVLENVESDVLWAIWDKVQRHDRALAPILDFTDDVLTKFPARL